MPIDFEPEKPKIDFEPAGIDFTPESSISANAPRVAEMASATRGALGLVGRAIQAFDIAQAGAVAQEEIGALETPPVAEVGVDQFGKPLDPRGRNPAQLNPAWEGTKLTDSAGLAPLMAPLVPLREAFSQGAQLSYLASQQPEGAVKKTMEVASGVVSGAEDVVGGAMEFLTSPVGIATMGLGSAPGALRSIASATFAADMASHAPESLKAFNEATTPEAKARALVGGLGNLAMAGLAGSHAYGETLKAISPQAKLSSVAPMTSEAVGKVEPVPVLAEPSLTPLTAEAVKSAKEPVVKTPAPSPTAEISELGTAPVPAGAEPPAKLAVAQAEPIAKPQSERPLTKVPEQFLQSKTVLDILSEEKAVQPPEGGLNTALIPATEGGAIFGAGGRRATPPKAAGVTPRGDKNWLRIPSAIKRVGRGLFTEGARAVLERSKNQVGQALSDATRRHVDIEQELFGQHEAVLREAVSAIPKERLDSAFTEASQYIREVENNRPAPPVSAEAQSILDAWFEVGKSTGDIARANDVQVFDPKLGKHRPMGTVEDYVPRMFSQEVEAVLRDPQSDPVLFNKLADAIATKKGISIDDAAAELRGVAGRFQSNDYMANLEMARAEAMPEIFYDYDLRNLITRYLPSFSERMAQIISYGQRLGTRENPTKKNLWDIARREAEDSRTQEWLNAAEDQATAFKPKNALEKNARRLQAISSASLLSDPTTTVVRNLLSGVASTTEAYGGRSVKAFSEAMKTSSRLAAREAGVIRDDLAAFLNSDQLGNTPLDSAIREITTFALGKSGFTGSENFVRTHNAIAASGFVRDAAAALAKNPASKLSKEALAQFKRWDVDPEAVIKEGGDWRTGAESRKYVRTAVREMQGGYRFDQVPLWANSTAGRFFYQYGRWGVQRAQNIFQNIIKPAIGEEVTFRGKKMVHRDVLPLIRAAALTIGLGETFGAISSGLFGKDRRDSSLSEIGEAWNDDELKAVQLLGERMVNDIIMAGTLGIIGQPLDIAKAAKDQSRFKNPLDPPSAAGVKTLLTLAQRAIDQGGTLTKKDLLDAASGIIRGPKNVTDVARNLTGESLYMGQNDQRTLRNAATRWAKETGQDVPVRGGRDMRKAPTAPAYEAVNEALLAGNAEKARKAAEDFIESQKDKAKARAAVRASVRARQPFRAGNMTSDEHRNAFMEWAKKNLSEDDLSQIERIQRIYEQTASEAGLQ